MRSKQPLSESERFAVGNIKVINRGKGADADPAALTSVLNSYYALADDYKNGDAAYYEGYNNTIAFYKETAEATEDVATRYTQLQKINRTRRSLPLLRQAVIALRRLQMHWQKVSKSLPMVISRTEM